MSNKLDKILNDSELLHFMAYLYDRWQEECKFESFEEYEKAIKQKVPKVEGLEFIKAKKRPFGFEISLEGEKYMVYLKHYKRGYFSLVAKTI